MCDDTQDDGREAVLQARLAGAREGSLGAWMLVRGVRQADNALYRAATDAGELIPVWAARAMFTAKNKAEDAYELAMTEVRTAQAALREHAGQRLAAASAAAAALAAGTVTQ